MLSRHLRFLRRRYIINRVLINFTIALTVDILFDLTAAAMYALLGFRMGIPFLFETLFFVLMLRELARGSIETFASMIDSQYGLKDRLYSHVWFSQSNRVSGNMKAAQALETLGSVNFEDLARTMRVRVPWTLLITLPLFGSLLYLTWNADYRPPGITTRIITDQIAPPSHPAIPGTTGVQTAQPGPETDPGQSDRTRERDLADEKDPLSGEAISQQEQDVAVDPEGVPDLGDPDEPGTGSPGTGGSAGGLTRAPESLESNFESPTAADPVPPTLAASAEYSFQELPDATRFLNLIPGQGSRSLTRLDPEVIANFEEGIDEFPDRYRQALQTYYWELKKWSQQQ
jgi:hypothetical protein